MPNGIRFLLIIFIFVSNLSFSQTIPFFSDNYAIYRWKADSLFNLNQISKSVEFYHKALSEKPKGRFKRYCFYQLFLCYDRLNDNSKASSFLLLSTKYNLRYNTISDFNNDTLLSKYARTILWEKISKNILSNIKKFQNNGFDTLLIKKLAQVRNRDQMYRRLSKKFVDSLRLIHGTNYETVLSNLIKPCDSMNRIEIKENLKKKWVGFKQVGIDGEQAIWLVAQHSDDDLAFQKKCLKLISKAVLNEDTPLHHYTYLHDRVNVNSNLNQVFGTQFYNIYPSSDFQLKKSISSIRIDYFRNCFAMEKVSDYLKFANKNYNSN